MKEIDTKGKTVLVRADLNVPIKEGKVTSDLRIRASVPTIEYLRGQGAKVVVISHLGRPEGKASKEMSLLPVAERLREILAGGAAGELGDAEKVKNVVKFVPETTGEKVQEAVRKLKPGEVLLLENLRFDPREEENDEGFAKEIIEATGAEVFVQDGLRWCIGRMRRQTRWRGSSQAWRGCCSRKRWRRLRKRWSGQSTR